MNLQTVITNLRNTIAGKEKYLAEQKENLHSEDPHVRMMAYPVSKMLELNIAELNRILGDLVEVSVKGINLSWQQNPDRSGGQFTQDEIDNAGRWQ